MASKISKKEWTVLYIIAGAIDLIQLLADLFLTEVFGAPEITSAILDPFIGAGFLIYFQIFKKVSMINRFDRVVSLLCVVGLEELSLGIAPAWIADIWYIHRSVAKEEIEIKPDKPVGITPPRNIRPEPVNLKANIRQPRFRIPPIVGK